MKREILEIKLSRQKRRTQFLFNSGEFRPRKEKSLKGYSRHEKHREREMFAAAY
jgi:stalled ribosome alternative rescue factor ArfA